MLTSCSSTLLFLHLNNIKLSGFVSALCSCALQSPDYSLYNVLQSPLCVVDYLSCYLYPPPNDTHSVSISKHFVVINRTFFPLHCQLEALLPIFLLFIEYDHWFLCILLFIVSCTVPSVSLSCFYCPLEAFKVFFSAGNLTSVNSCLKTGLSIICSLQIFTS